MAPAEQAAAHECVTLPHPLLLQVSRTVWVPSLGPFFFWFSDLFYIFSASLWRCPWAGRAAGRPRNAAKCTEWSARTSGAPPAAGRKPASASLTKAGEARDQNPDGRMSAKDFYHEEDTNQGLRAIHNHFFFPGVFVLLFCFFPPFPKTTQMEFSVSSYSDPENWSLRWC